MQPLIILERSTKHFSKFVNLLRNNDEIAVKDIKGMVCHSSYYAIIIRKVYALNKLLREINPKLYFAEPNFSLTDSRKAVYTSLKRCPLIEIEVKQEYYVVRFKA